MQKDERLEQALIDDLTTRIERETGIDIRKQHVTDKVALDLMDWLSQTADDPDWSQIAHQFVNQETSFFRSHSVCLLYTSPSPRDGLLSRMPSSA